MKKKTPSNIEFIGGIVLLQPHNTHDIHSILKGKPDDLFTVFTSSPDGFTKITMTREQLKNYKANL